MIPKSLLLLTLFEVNFQIKLSTKNVVPYAWKITIFCNCVYLIQACWLCKDTQNFYLCEVWYVEIKKEILVWELKLLF